MIRYIVPALQKRQQHAVPFVRRGKGRAVFRNYRTSPTSPSGAVVAARGQIVDIHNRRIFPGEVHIDGTKITSIREGIAASSSKDNNSHQQQEQQYILPGFVDSHVHVESSLLIPSEFARLAVRHGTVATVSDPHEIANVCGLKGIEFMLENANQVPFHFFFGAPSCVPATQFETAGATICPSDIEELFDNPKYYCDNGHSKIKYLAEMMNWPGVIAEDPDCLRKIQIALERNLPVDGHAPMVRSPQIELYAKHGMTTDHESFGLEEAKEKIAAGLKVQIRQGSGARNFDALHPILGMFPNLTMFCCDDTHPDLLMEQHLDWHVRESVKLGYDLFDVLRAASFNTIEHYQLPVGMLRQGDNADFIIVNNLQDFNVQETWINGQCVARNKQPLFEGVSLPKESLINNFNRHDPICVEDIRSSSRNDEDSNKKPVRVIVAHDGQLVTTEEHLFPHRDPDVLKIINVNRYDPNNASPIATAYIKGIGLQQGAFAGSVAHDSHNIVAVGCNDVDLINAVNGIIDVKGGLSFSKDGETMVLPLPVAGLMSPNNGPDVAKEYILLDRLVKENGSKLRAPYMTLSFMALLVIPQLKLSDKGLFDGTKFKFVNVSLDDDDDDEEEEEEDGSSACPPPSAGNMNHSKGGVVPGIGVSRREYSTSSSASGQATNHQQSKWETYEKSLDDLLDSPRNATGTAVRRDQFEQYKKIVDDLECTNDLPSSDKIRHALFGFVNQKTSHYASKNNMPEVPGECIKKLVDLMDYHYQNNPRANEEWVKECIDLQTNKIRNRSPYDGLAQACEFFLRPLMGTAYSVRRPQHWKKNRLQQEEVLQALQNSSRAYSLMKRVGGDKLLQDRIAANAALRLWKARCWYFGNGNFSAVQLSPEILQDLLGGAQGTEDCLEAMIEIIDKLDDNQNLDAIDREVAYSTLVAAMAWTGTVGSAHRAREVLRKFEERYEVQRGAIHGPVMLAYANEASINPEAARGASDFWDYICSSKNHLKPHPAVFNSLLLAYSNAEMPEECEKLLIRQEKSSQGGHVPTTIDYNVAINSWAKARADRTGRAKRAIVLFRHMAELAQQRPDVKPDTITYTVLIDALVKDPNTGKEGIDLAENLLQHCESGNESNVQPDSTLYHTYMKALAVRLTRQSDTRAKIRIAERIESLLFRMKEKSFQVPKSMSSDWHNSSIYGIAIDAWTRTNAYQAPKRALELYSMLKEEGNRAGGIDSLKPGMELYHDLLKCIGTKKNAGDPNPRLANHIATVANRLLNDIESEGYTYTVVTLSLYLRVLSSLGIREALQEAEYRLQILEDAYSNGAPTVVPDSYSYQVVMEGYARLPGSADPECAEHLLNLMIELSEKWEDRKAHIFPEPACFTVVMDAWVKSGREDAAHNVERIMKKAEELGVLPTEHMYTTLINSYAGRFDGPERAEEIITQIKSDYESGKNQYCKPTGIMFSTFLKCWALSGRKDAAEEMEKIVMHLHEIKDHDEYGYLSLNYSAFKHVLIGWQKISNTRQDAGDRSLHLMEMVDEYMRKGKLEADHVMHCYSIALVTISHCLDSKKAAKAFSLLRHMKEGGHNIRSKDFKAVLRACKETGMLHGGVSEVQKQEAFRIASITFLEYLESGNLPDEDVYKEMVDLHGTLLSAGSTRDLLLRGLLSKAPIGIRESKVIKDSLRPILSTLT